MTVERNRRIVACRERGWSLKTIAQVEGIAYGTVSAVLSANRPRPGDGPVPDGMSIKTARDIEAAIGIWPSVETAPEIAARIMDVMDGARKRNTMKDLGDWLRTLGIQP